MPLQNLRDDRFIRRIRIFDEKWVYFNNPEQTKSMVEALASSLTDSKT